jgi:hypothetical protein
VDQNAPKVGQETGVGLRRLLKAHESEVQVLAATVWRHAMQQKVRSADPSGAAGWPRQGSALLLLD